MTVTAPPHCLWCKHLDYSKSADEPLTCAAFPSGIPDDILSGADGHWHARGLADNGIAFEVATTDSGYWQMRMRSGG